MRLMTDYMSSAQNAELLAYLDVSQVEVDEICDAIHAFLSREGQRFSSHDIVRMAKAYSDVSAEYTLPEFFELAECGC